MPSYSNPLLRKFNNWQVPITGLASPRPAAPTPQAAPTPASPANHTTPSYSQTYNEGPVSQVEQQYFQDQQDWNNDKHKYQGKESSAPEPVVEEKFKHMLAIMGGGSRSGSRGEMGRGRSSGLSRNMPQFGGTPSFGGNGLQTYLQDRMRKRNKFQDPMSNTGSTQNRLLSRYLGGA